MNTSKIRLLVIASLLIYSCGQSKNWSDKEQKEFIKNCLQSNKDRVSVNEAKEICDCMLNKVMEKHQSMTESKKTKREIIKKTEASCRKKSVQEQKQKDINTPVAMFKKNHVTQKKATNNIEQIIDTTSYLNDCFDTFIPNSNIKFRAIEKELIENKILESNSPEAFRKLHLIYIKYQNIDDMKNTPLYFERKFKISKIVKILNIPKSLIKKEPKCFLEIIENAKFKKSSIVRYINKENKFDEISISGEAPKEWDKFNSIDEILNSHFEITLFKSKDVKNMILLKLFFYTHSYKKEDMDNDIRIHK